MSKEAKLSLGARQWNFNDKREEHDEDPNVVKFLSFLRNLENKVRQQPIVNRPSLTAGATATNKPTDAKLLVNVSRHGSPDGKWIVEQPGPEQEKALMSDCRDRLNVMFVNMQGPAGLDALYPTGVAELVDRFVDILYFTRRDHLDPIAFFGAMIDKLGSYRPSKQDEERSLADPYTMRVAMATLITEGTLPDKDVFRGRLQHVAGILQQHAKLYARWTANLKFWNFLIESFPEGTTVIDAGCGTGLWSLVYHNLGYNVLAFDPYTANDPYQTARSGVYYPFVQRITHDVFLKQHETQGTILSLGYPGLESRGGAWAHEFLTKFKGYLVIYIGEYRASCGTPKLFDLFDKQWKVIKCFALPTIHFTTAATQLRMDKKKGDHVPMHTMDAIFVLRRISFGR